MHGYQNAQQVLGQVYPGDMPQESELSLIESHLAQLTERLAQSVGELGSLGDRLFGSRPEPAGKPASTTAAGGLLVSLRDRVEGLSVEIGVLEERVKRLLGL